MELDVIYENLVSCVDFELEQIGECELLEDLSDLCGLLSQEYRSLAICKLLMDGDTDGFYHDLIRSAKTWLYFLDKNYTSHSSVRITICASRNSAIFDALSAAQVHIAAQIAGMSSSIWSPDDEYEDDFWYAHFINLFVLYTVTRKAIHFDEVLNSFEASLKGASDIRYKLCRALLEKNAGDFEFYFECLLKERSTLIRSDEDTAIGEEISFNLEKHVYIEGLALLRLAENVGINCNQEFLYCPPLARIPMVKEFPGGGYPKK